MAIKTASTRKTTSSSSLSSTYSATAIIRQVIITDSNYIALDNTVDTAVSNTGGYIKILGVGFMSGYSLYFNGVAIATSTLISSNEILAVIPSIGNGSYTLTLFNTNNTGALYILTASGFPTWTTSSYTTNTTTINIQLVVAGDAPLTYELQSGSTLPAGISLTSTGILTGTISGGITTDTTYSFTVIVTDLQLQSTQQLITLNVTFGDSNFKNTTLLLNGETTVTPFISDASTNSFGLTINGDTKPVLFNPYQGDGYYSNYFDGTGDFLTAPANAAWNFTGDWTFECWVYPTAITGYHTFLAQWGAPDNVFIWKMNSSGRMYLENLSTAITATTTTILANQWQHIALTRNSDTIRMFVNGVLDATTATRSGTYYSSGAMKISANDTGANESFIGYMSNMRILNGTALYTTTFTPPTTTLTAITNTSLLTCQSNRFIDNSTNVFAITKAGDTLISPAIPFTANSSYSTYGSTYFDGTGDYITAPSNVALNLTGDFTIEFWVYPTASIASKSIAGTTSSSMHFDSGGYLYLLNSIGQYLRATDASFLTLNTWTHVAISRSGATLKFFRNGIDNGIAENVGSASTATFTFSGLNIGYSPHVNASSYLTGYISDFRVVKGTAVYTANFTPSTTPLTAIANTSLLTLQYNGGATNKGIIDNSNFNNIITRFGNTSQGSFSPYSVTGWSNYFDGTGDYLSVPGNAAFQFTADFTVECWVYLQRVTGYQVLVGQYPSAGVYGWMFQMNNGATMRVIFNNSATTGAITTSATLAANQWYHVALTRSGTSITLWFNGTSVGTSTLSGNIGTVTDAVWIGNGGSTDYVQGYISNVRVLKGTVLYTSTFTPPTSPLTPITNTSLLTCQSNRIIDNSPNSFTITKNGDVSVQAFGPFGSIREAVPISYSNYFDGVVGTYIITPVNTAFNVGAGNFTVEGWYYFNSLIISQQEIFTFSGATTFNFIMFVWNDGVIYFRSAETSGEIVSPFASGMVVGVWYHWAVTRVGNVYTIYRNGVSVASATSTAIVNENKSFSTGKKLSGHVSNVRVIKGTALYTSTFTPSTTPLTTTSQSATASQVSLLTCQSTTIIDNSTNAFTITAAGNTVPRIFNPFGYTEQSGTSYTPTTHGGSVYFDGTGDTLTIPSPTTGFSFGTGEFTIEMWVYKTSAENDGLLDARSSAAATPWFLGIDASNFPYFYDGTSYTSSVAVTLNSWSHVSIVRTSGVLKMFVNGVQGYSASYGTNLDRTAGLVIGDTIHAAAPLLGYISNLRIVKGTAVYTSAFVPPTQTIGNYSTSIPSTLLLNFNNGGIVDQHGTNVLETVGNTQLSTAVKKYNVASIYFDGTGDRLATSPGPLNSLGSGDFTIEFWAYSITLPSNARLLSQGTSTTGEYLFIVYSTGAADFCEASTARLSFPTGSFVTATWQHIAIARSGTTLKGYVNGSSVVTTTSTYNYSAVTNTYIGSNPSTGSQDFNGYIDDLRITKGFARYTANFTAPTTALSLR